MIQKFSIGGSSAFIAGLNPIFADENQKTTTATKKQQSLVDTDLLKSLNGLPVDVDQLVDEIANLEYRQSVGLPVSQSEIHQITKDINRVSRFSDYMKDAESQAKQNDSLADIAISDSGSIWVAKENGQISTKSLENFDAEKERALTVSDLINLRKHNNSFAFDTELIKTIGTSVGLTKIQKYITDIVQTMGESSTTTEAYTNIAQLYGRANATKPTQSELQALHAIFDIVEQSGPEAIFKIKNTQSDSNIQEGLDYLVRTLPKNMYQQLQAQYMSCGYSYADSKDAVQDTLWSALLSGNKHKFAQEIDYAANADKSFGKVKSTEDSRYQTTLEKFFNQNLNRVPGGVTISDPTYKNKYALSVPGTVNPSLVTDNDMGIGESPLDVALNYGGSGMLKYLDQSKIWFGEDHANREQLSKVYYTGDQIANVAMPTDGNGNINWEALHNYSAAEEEIKQKNITNIAGKNEIHKQHNSYVRYSDDGETYNMLPTEQFLMLHGVTSDDEITSDNMLYREIGRNREAYYNEKIASINKKYKTNLDKGGWFTDIVDVPVFIKIQPNAAIDAAYYAKKGSLVPKRTLQEDMTYQQTQAPASTQIMGDASLLYQE